MDLFNIKNPFNSLNDIKMIEVQDIFRQYERLNPIEVWRKEDIQMVLEYLEKEGPVPNAPGWIKC